jgi:hypothetical protein
VYALPKNRLLSLLNTLISNIPLTHLLEVFDFVIGAAHMEDAWNNLSSTFTGTHYSTVAL